MARDTQVECNHIDCKGTHTLGVFYPVLLLRPKNYKGRSPARVCIKLPLCEEHAKAKTAEEFITEQAWNMIVGGFRSLRRQVPHRSSTKIEFVYITTEIWKTTSLFIFDPMRVDN